MRQLATEYLEFTQRSLERRGYRVLKLSDEFVEANLHQLILRARRFTSHRTERDEIVAAQLRLKEAAKTLLREFPEACQVAAVIIAAEQPDDSRLLGFVAALANLKL